MHFKDRSGKLIQYEVVNNTMQDVLHFMSHENNSFLLKKPSFLFQKNFSYLQNMFEITAPGTTFIS